MSIIADPKATQTYDVTIDQLRRLIAADLGTPPDQEILIEERRASTDPMDRGPDVFVGIRVTVRGRSVR